MTDTTPVSWEFLTPVWHSPYSMRLRNLKSVHPQNDHVTRQRPFRGEIFYRWVGLAVVDLPNLKSVPSSIPEILKGV